MNKIVNKFLLPGYKIMSKLHLGQPRFTYIAFGMFAKHLKEFKILGK